MAQNEDVDDGQRSAWWADFTALLDELAGRVRRHRPWRDWWYAVLLAAAFVGLAGAGWSRYDPSVNAPSVAPSWLRFGLIGVGAVIVVIATLRSWGSGALGGARYSPMAVLRPDQQRRCLRLAQAADAGDPDQVRAATDLAQRVAVQRPQGWLNVAFVLLMLSIVLGNDPDLWWLAPFLLVLLAHAGQLVTRELRVRRARSFLQAHPLPVPAPAG